MNHGLNGGAKASATTEPRWRKLILLIDDSPTAHMWIQRVLDCNAYRMVAARDGVEGIEVALATRPDLILMDAVMPRMNGYEATRELRRREETRHTPIVMLTTRGEAKNVELGYESGCADYVTKPISSVDLLEKIEDLLRQAAA